MLLLRWIQVHEVVLKLSKMRYHIQSFLFSFSRPEHQVSLLLYEQHY